MRSRVKSLFAGLLPLIFTVFASGNLSGVTFVVGEGEVAPGDPIEIPVSVTAFDEVIAIQFSLEWDPGQFSFSGVRGDGLPHVGESNFGTTRSDEGKLGFVWFDLDIEGVSVADGTVIFYLELTAVGSPGGGSSLRLGEEPTPGEVVIHHPDDVFEEIEFGFLDADLKIRKLPQSLVFNSIADAPFGTTVSLAASADSDLPVSFVLIQGSARIEGSELIPMNLGMVRVRALQEGNEHFLPAEPVERSFEVTTGMAALSLSNLQHTYDGGGKAASVSTSPSGLAVSVTYDGQTELPKNAGEYVVVAVANSTFYEGQASGTLRISRAPVHISLGDFLHSYDGSEKAATVETEPAGYDVQVTYNGESALPVNAGDYEVVAVVDEENHAGTAEGVLTVEKVPERLTFGPLPDRTFGDEPFPVEVHVASGRPLTSLEVESGPAVLDGNMISVHGVGLVVVRARREGDINHMGAVEQTFFHVRRAPVELELEEMTQVYDGLPKEIFVERPPGDFDVRVTYDGSETPPVDAGTYEVIASVADNPNYEGAAEGVLTVRKAPVAVALENLVQVYDGTEREIGVETDPPHLDVRVTYEGGPELPAVVGSYDVVAVVEASNYEGSAEGVLTIEKAQAEITLGHLERTYDGTSKAVSVHTLPSGLLVSVTYAGRESPPVSVGEYPVLARVVDASYTGVKEAVLSIKPLPPVVAPATARGEAGEAFRYEITTNNPASGYDAHGLPSGLVLDSESGVISGTPEGAGSFLVSLSAFNDGGTSSAFLRLTIGTREGAPVIMSPERLNILAHSSFRYALNTLHPATSFRLADLPDGTAGVLPEGITFDEETGILSGMATVPGLYEVAIVAINAEGADRILLQVEVQPSRFAPVIDSAGIASARAGSEFFFQITASNNPATFFATGLPEGLDLDEETGVISGTPLTPGAGNVWLSARGEVAQGGESPLMLTVHPAAETPLVISSPVAVGRVGEPFAYSISTDRTANRFELEGELPEGLEFSIDEGVISGIPKAGGSAQVRISAYGETGEGPVLDLDLEIEPVAEAPVLIGNLHGSAQQGSLFRHRIYASNDPTSFVIQGEDKELRDFGLSFDTRTGVISGLPNRAAAGLRFEVKATNEWGESKARVFYLDVHPRRSSPVIVSFPEAGGRVGELFSHRIEATNGADTFFASDLPAGLVLEEDGEISGIPREAGNFSVSVEAANDGGFGSGATLRLILSPAKGAPAILSSHFTRGMVGESFSYRVEAIPGTISSYHMDGTLPAGLRFNSRIGVIEGKAVEAGLFELWITAANAAGSGFPQKITLRIDPDSRAPRITSSLRASARAGEPFSYVLETANLPAERPLSPPDRLFATGLPKGLAFNPVTGEISGSPREAGDFNVELTGANEYGRGETRVLEIAVKPHLDAPELDLESHRYSGQAGVPFALSLATQSAGGELKVQTQGGDTGFDARERPAWLRLDPESGVLNGTPPEPGIYRVLLSGADNNGEGPLEFIEIRIYAAEGAPVITSARKAQGSVGEFFHYEIEATASPASFRAPGLPAGFVLDKETGEIRGIPLASGTFEVTLAAENAQGVSDKVHLALSIAPEQPKSIALNGGWTDDGYDFRLETDPPIEAEDFFIVNGLPEGLAAQSSTGRIRGISRKTGTFPLVVAWKRSSATHFFEMEMVLQPLADSPLVTSDSSASGTVGESFLYQLEGSGEPTSFNVGLLPDGLSYDAFGRTITGVPTVAGLYSVRLSANNSEGTGPESLLEITVHPRFPVPVFTGDLQVSAQVKAPFSYFLSADHDPVHFRAEGLPPGLVLDFGTGHISGEADISGVFPVVVSARNEEGVGPTAELTLIIGEVPVTPSGLQFEGFQGQSVSFNLSATHDPLSFNVDELPEGLSVDLKTGLVTGVPLVRGESEVAVSANNANGTGPAGSWSIRILSAYEGWVREKGIPVEERDPGHDPADDGVPNLLKFVLAMDPLSAAQGITPAARLLEEEDGAYPALRFIRAKNAIDVLLVLESSSDLVTWQEVASTLQVVEEVDQERELIELREDRPIQDSSRRFLRLKVVPLF